MYDINGARHGKKAVCQIYSVTSYCLSKAKGAGIVSLMITTDGTEYLGDAVPNTKSLKYKC